MSQWRACRWAAASAAVWLVVTTPPVAWAVQPPVVPSGPPPTGPVAPSEPTEQTASCGVTGLLPQTDLNLEPHAAEMLNFVEAWRFSRGAGQKVAVIDTGVNRHPRLPRLEGGGDYVSSSDGLMDCDAHGTVVAGVIAASPSPDDAFAGVAPDAAILSIRQHSGVYDVAGARSADDDPNAVSTGYGNIATLARAITRSVDLGATVINVSVVACAPAGAGLNDAELGMAVRYAFERNVVVVVAAGNIDEQGKCNAQNTVRDPNLPLEHHWESVQTIVSPAWFSDYVLAVAALTASGEPAEFSVRGPWVDVAAPGELITSVDPNGAGLVNAWLDQKGLVPINGTSFAAPFVAGVVALIRSRFPDLTAGEVMDLVKRTAHTPGSGPNAATGHGVVDPIAALTYRLPPAAGVPDPNGGRPIAGPAQPDPVDQRARYIVLTVTGVCVAMSAVALAVVAPRRRQRTSGGDEAAQHQQN